MTRNLAFSGGRVGHLSFVSRENPPPPLLPPRHHHWLPSSCLNPAKRADEACWDPTWKVSACIWERRVNNVADSALFVEFWSGCSWPVVYCWHLQQNLVRKNFLQFWRFVYWIAFTGTDAILPLPIRLLRFVSLFWSGTWWLSGPSMTQLKRFKRTSTQEVYVFFAGFLKSSVLFRVRST